MGWGQPPPLLHLGGIAMYKVKQQLHALLPYTKYLCLLMYCLMAILVWPFRSYLPVQLGGLVSDLVAFSLLLVGFLLLYDLLRRPFGIARRVDRTLHRWKIKTSSGEYPVLKRVHKSPYKEHELILEFDGKGIGLTDMDKHLEHWQVGLNGKIRMDYGQKDGTLLLYLLPRRYVQPLHISLESTQLCREPNMLVVGKTGSGKSYALTVVLGIYAHFSLSTSIVICDYKMSSFSQFSDSPNFYGEVYPKSRTI